MPRSDRSTRFITRVPSGAAARRGVVLLVATVALGALLAGCAKDETAPSTLPVTGTATSAAGRPSGSGTTPSTARGTTPGTTGTTRATTTSRPATSSTTGAASTSSSGAPGSTATPARPTTPEGFAKALVAAWAAGDRQAAAQVAEASAVTKLFSFADQDPSGYQFVDCGGAAGSTICRFNAGSETLLVSVRNTTGGEAMEVTDVRITGAGG